MILQDTTILGYRRLEASNIRQLDVEFNQPIQMIVAANGKGKSSTMALLSPRAINKHDFHKHGLVRHTIEHDSDIYTLEIRPHDKHTYSFRGPDNVELNQSGNTGSYEEYLKEVFNYDRDIDKLMRLQYRMTSMTPTQREAFITRFNPANLQLLSAYYKRVSTATRAIKSQIKLLQQRKSTLEDKVLSPEQLSQLESVSIDRNATIRSYEEALLLLRNRIAQVQQSLPNTNNEYDALKRRHDYLVRQLHTIAKDPAWSTYGYHDLSHQLESIAQQQQQAEARIQQQLAVYEQYREYQHLNVQEELSTRQSRLQEIDALLPHLRADLSIPSDPTVLHRTIAYLKEVCTIVADIHPSLPIYSIHQSQRISAKLDYIRFKYTTMEQQYTGVQTEIEQVERSIALLHTDRISPLCNVPECDLRTRVEQRVRTQTDRLTQLTTQSGTLRLQIDKYGRVRARLADMLERTRHLKPQLDRLAHVETVDWLASHLLTSTLADTINHSSTALCGRCNTLITMIQDRLTHDELKKEHDRLSLEVAQITAKDIPVQAMVEQMVATTQRDIHTHQSIVQSTVSATTALATHQTTQSRVVEIQQELIATVQTMTALLERDLIQFYLRILRTVEDTLVAQHTTAVQLQREERIYLEEQRSHHIILTQEVLPTLADLTSKHEEYQLLQEALSPKSGYPNQYLVDFINQHIATANQILKSTWNYDMAMVPLVRGEDVTFEIARVIEGESAKDIALSSDSQKDIFDIAFSLALIIGNGYGQQFPLYMDEVDKHFDESHREGLVRLIQDQIRSGNIRQIFMVNHHIVMNAGLPQSDVVCLSTDYIRVPDHHNEHTKIVHF